MSSGILGSYALSQLCVMAAIMRLPYGCCVHGQKHCVNALKNEIAIIQEKVYPEVNVLAVHKRVMSLIKDLGRALPESS